MAAETLKLYVIPLQAHEAIGLRIAEVCWGSCGNGLIGGVDLGNQGEAIPCITPAAQCPAFDEEMSEPWGTVPDGRDPERPVYLRKLRAPWRTIRPSWHKRLRAWLGSPRYWHLRLYRWAFPDPPRCETCGGPLRDHKPKQPLTAKHFLDKEYFYGSRLRAESDGILVTIYVVDCSGDVRDSVLLLSSDAESLRDALDDYLAREDEFYRISHRMAVEEVGKL
jgi:hypothetical protein